jgi:hypothetical protein
MISGFWDLGLLRCQKALNAKYVQNRAWINMSNTDNSLQMILDNILNEYASSGKKIPDSTVNKEHEEMREITTKTAVILLNKLKSEPRQS